MMMNSPDTRDNHGLIIVIFLYFIFEHIVILPNSSRNRKKNVSPF